MSLPLFITKEILLSMMETFTVYDSPFGLLRIEYDGDCIIGIKKERGEALDRGERTAFTEEVVRQLEEYFVGKRQTFDFPYEVRGTAFQLKVWEALRQIPYGEIRSYKDIAVAVGSPKASRAVGMANNKNPILLVVPCHRVIGADGRLVGYGAGLEMKESLLEMERVISARNK